MNKIALVTNFVSDASEIADKTDFFTEFITEHDEILSTNSWTKHCKSILR